MNVLFLTIGRMESIEAHSIYPDLLRQFRDAGHSVYIVSQREKRMNLPTELKKENGVQILYVRIGNITKCNFVEKGISTIMIQKQYLQAIEKYYSGIKFDLILYTTPPITLVNVVDTIKKRDGARTYLLLKDIFPQNAADLGILKKTGIKGLIYKYFRIKEKKLYRISDKIGCMSKANVEYVLNNNPEVKPDKVEICPNSIEVQNLSLSEEERIEMRKKYGIPTDKKVFVYGGNLGRPQCVPFIVKCLKACAETENVFFVVAGSGTDRYILEKYMDEEKPKHVKLFGQIPKEEYDKMIACCDVGLIFLDHRFTIPNFPSRLLSYMQAGLPVLACTDPNTDIGQVITDGGFGWWCESDDETAFAKVVEKCKAEDTQALGCKAFEYLQDNYSADKAYRTIMS